MKNSIKRVLAIGVFTIAIGAVSACFGQITGAYGDADVKSKEVKSAAAFAVKQLGNEESANIGLVDISAARIQVVAGLNYELCMEVNVSRGSKKAKRYVKAVVYQDLKKKYQLTQWTLSTEAQTCGDGQ